MSIISERKKLAVEQYIPAEIRILTGNEPFNRRLIITIPGEPVSDGRPRKNDDLNIFYNAKKQFLKQIMMEIYKIDQVLKKTCIITPHRIICNTYSYPKQNELKFLEDKEILYEEVYSVQMKDNDNIEKVHWDVLQDSSFMVILDDTYTVGNMTHKYYSYNPRVTIHIDYSTDFQHPLHEHKVLNSTAYRSYLCSKKYTIDMGKVKYENIPNYLSIKLAEMKSTNKKKMLYILMWYSSDIIDELYKIMVFGNGKVNDLVRQYIKKMKKQIKMDVICDIFTSTSNKAKEKLEELKKNIKKEIPKND